MEKGRVVRIESKDVYVVTQSGETVRCVVPGKIKKKFLLKKNKLKTLDIVAVGDYVSFEIKNERGEKIGVIEEIEERKNYVSRKAPKIRGRGEKGKRLEQTVAANVDKLVIVSSIKMPEFNNRFVDRMLVIAESSNVEPLIVINKTDLDENAEHKKWLDLYESAGYAVIPVSAAKKINIEKVRAETENGTSIFWGRSGVGKSSLLNALFGLNLKIGEISDFSNKGKHTTVTSVLIKIDEKTSVIDTPGVREIEPYGITKESLGHYFAEFAEFIPQCKFNSCTHFHEPGCAVRKAVEEGKISSERYRSYLNLLQTVEE